jgi:hypothetical protein|tara:strand:+ start:2396 stop:2593 length:198 start_codon:yes stop_codon:yes gene_type:complete
MEKEWQIEKDDDEWFIHTGGNIIVTVREAMVVGAGKDYDKQKLIEQKKAKELAISIHHSLNAGTL